MKTYYIGFIIVFVGIFFSCTEQKVENESATKSPELKSDSSIVEVLSPQLKTDFPERVYVFRKMSDSTTEQQVLKYETFAALFIEYGEIYKNHKEYSISDQENNTEAYNVLKDEWVSLKLKLKKKMSLITPAYEKRLDAADAKMNVHLPETLKEKK
ncbi:hypothetical protein [uncultured Cytophaga sp.]|uniref:hypothetical protein n=1 Tax=uncultured Cytophaga sp. TaxID=160238 RepID=UPI0026239747|nr:hypothetical protein [uncultured Cytophaga sp.]